MPWGKGETPIADILLLIKKNKWPIYADIELEYPVPEGSDAVAEVRKCVEFCKEYTVLEIIDGSWQAVWHGSQCTEWYYRRENYIWKYKTGC